MEPRTFIVYRLANGWLVQLIRRTGEAELIDYHIAKDLKAVAKVIEELSVLKVEA